MLGIQCFLIHTVDRKGRFKYGNNDRWKSVIHDLPVGGMYFADWIERKGPDGHHLIVRTPGGFWSPDNRSLVCDRPDDNIHRCWIRHGEPPNITIDKEGDTCSCSHMIGITAGLQGFYGQLTDGVLIEC